MLRVDGAVTSDRRRFEDVFAACAALLLGADACCTDAQLCFALRGATVGLREPCNHAN